MPESHNLALVLMDICTLFLSWHAQPNLVPSYHMFILDDEDAVISMLLVFMGIYVYLFWHAQTLIWSWSFPPYHKFIHDNEKCNKCIFLRKLETKFWQLLPVRENRIFISIDAVVKQSS